MFFFKPIKSTTCFDGSPKVWVILGRIISETSDKKNIRFCDCLFDRMEGNGNLDGKYIVFFNYPKQANHKNNIPAYDLIG